jgi:hypothetical protein
MYLTWPARMSCRAEWSRASLTRGRISSGFRTTQACPRLRNRRRSSIPVIAMALAGKRLVLANAYDPAIAHTSKTKASSLGLWTDAEFERRSLRPIPADFGHPTDIPLTWPQCRPQVFLTSASGRAVVISLPEFPGLMWFALISQPTQMLSLGSRTSLASIDPMVSAKTTNVPPCRHPWS